MVQRELVAVAVLLGAAGLYASAEELGVGDTAPKLEVKEFVKGEPVKEFEKGKIYVVEFWATWCPPCKATIPHLTELQKKFKDVIFIGVSVAEQDQSAVKPFVKEMGDQMDYRVAIDLVPEGKDGNDGAMAQNWMAAAGINGIPHAFVVNGEGKIAWIGNPGTMDETLGKIVAGKWDIKEPARLRKVEAMKKTIEDGLENGEPQEALKAINKAIAADAGMESHLALSKFRLLISKGGDVEKGLQYGKKLTEKVLKDDASGLNELAAAVVDPDAEEKPDAKLVEFALATAKQADEVAKGKDAAIADTLARAYFVNGDIANAVETQERAIKLMDASSEDDQVKRKLDEFKLHLDEYKKAAKK